MTYRIKARITTLDDPKYQVREVITNVAGCRDEAHAREKILGLYQGEIKVLWVKLPDAP